MNTPVQPQTTPPSNTPTPSSAVLGTNTGSAPSSAPATAPAEPWRAGAGAPQWAQGKTPEEILGLAVQLNDALGAQLQRPAVQNGNGGQTNGQPVQTAPFVEGQYVDGGELMRNAPQLIDQRVAPQFQNLYAMQGDTNLMMVKQNPAYSDVFNRYGPEVNAMLANVPKDRWSIDNLQKVVKMVQADHLDDLARLRAERIVSEQGLTLRSSGAALPNQPQPQPSNTMASDKIPAQWKERAVALGINDATVQEWCQQNAMTPDQFFAQFGNTVITEVTRRD